MIEILDPGLLTTIQDLGRPGFGALGVPPSGAADRESLVAANTLVGNPPAAACLETTLIGARVRVERDAVAVVTGAPATVSVDSSEVAFGRAVQVPAGCVVEVGPALRGVRSYLAFSGGIDAEPALGSRSTDLLTGLGPSPLDATMRLALADGSVAAVGQAVVPDVPAECELRVLPGPRMDRFESDALDRLVGGDWKVDPRSNRIGVRLQGEPLPLLPGSGSLRSEGLVVGALQVPPSGLPTVMLPDRPTTGGYPVVGVVVEDDLRLAGQLRPGTRVRFVIDELPV